MASNHENCRHRLAQDVKKILIVGAGVSGLAAVVQLRRAFHPNEIDITVVDKRGDVGGLWLYNQGEDQTKAANYLEGEDEWKRPIKQVYPDLHTNIPSIVMGFRTFPFPPETEPFPPASVVLDYIRAYVAHHQIPRHLFRFETLVSRLERCDGKWLARLAGLEGKEEERIFDAVVMANGHFEKRKGLFQVPLGDDVIHAREFRSPAAYSDKDVLVVGAGLSAKDIIRLLLPMARSVHQSLRPSSQDETEELGAIRHPPISALETTKVVFEDGSEMVRPHAIILATGYLYDFPFLHINPSIMAEDNGAGEYVSNLYKSIFYTSDPTLAFIGLQIKLTPFSVAEYQSLWMSRVWAEKCYLPCLNCLKKDEEEEPRDRTRHLLGDEGQANYVKMMLKACDFEPENPHNLGELPDWWFVARFGGKSKRKDLLGY